MTPYVVAMIALVGALLYAIRTERRWLEWVTKPLAAATFLAAALRDGMPESPYGQALVVGLVLASLGDVLLIPRDERSLLAGLVAFLLGHVLYGVAFVVRGVELVPALATGVVVIAAAVPIVRHLWPHLDGRTRGPVLAYVAVISAMVVLAVGTAGHAPDLAIPVGAIAFYVSDLAVARQRFVAPAFVNRAVGLPLYFGAQLLLASTV